MNCLIVLRHKTLQLISAGSCKGLRPFQIMAFAGIELFSQKCSHQIKLNQTCVCDDVIHVYYTAFYT
jgi:hypothetical protein